MHNPRSTPTDHARQESTTQIRQVGTVFVPVANQDRELKFYLEKLGFEKRVDASYGGGLRWIEVAPPGSTNAIPLVSKMEGEFAHSDETRFAFSTEDIEADLSTLRSRGVEVDEMVARTGKSRAGLLSTEVTVSDPMPPQFFFRDIDGNRFLIVEPVPPRPRSRSVPSS